MIFKSKDPPKSIANLPAIFTKSDLNSERVESISKIF